jgi:hypothetical protein
MSRIYRPLCCCVMVWLLVALASAQTTGTDEIVANQNRISAGKLEQSVLEV